MQADSFWLSFYLGNAGRADFLTLKFNYITLVAAEMAVGLIFGKYNFITFYIYFNGVGAFDLQFLAYFLRDDNSSKLVDVAKYTG